MPKFIMLVGLPGSGKTTFANTYLMNTAVHISSDAVIEDIAEGLNKTYDEVWGISADSAQSLANGAVGFASILMQDIVLDQTNLSAKSRARKLSLLKNKDKYTTIAIVFDEPEQVIADRLAQRPGKTIPDSVLKSMVKNYTKPSTETEAFDHVYTPAQFLEAFYA